MCSDSRRFLVPINALSGTNQDFGDWREPARITRLLSPEMAQETFYIHHRRTDTAGGVKDKHLYKTALPVTGGPSKRLRAEAKRLKETLMFKDWVGRRLYAVDANTHQTLARCNVLRSEMEHAAGGKYRLMINVYHQGSDGVFRGPGPGEQEKVAHPLTAVKEAVRECMTQEPGEESWLDWYAEAVHPDTGELLAICRFQHVIDRDRERLAFELPFGVVVEKDQGLER